MNERCAEQRKAGTLRNGKIEFFRYTVKGCRDFTTTADNIKGFFVFTMKMSASFRTTL